MWLCHQINVALLINHSATPWSASSPIFCNFPEHLIMMSVHCYSCPSSHDITKFWNPCQLFVNNFASSLTPFCIFFFTKQSPFFLIAVCSQAWYPLSWHQHQPRVGHPMAVLSTLSPPKVHTGMADAVSLLGVLTHLSNSICPELALFSSRPFLITLPFRVTLYCLFSSHAE